MDEEEREKLPKWARERLEVEEDMGTLETSASPATVVLGTFYILFRISIFVLGCVIIYLIGKAVVD